MSEPISKTMPSDGNSGEADGILFDAVLQPYRSLSPQGFLWLMIAMGVCSSIIGLLFLMRGAWPVFGFCGLEVAILYFALRHNFASARFWERLTLSERDLTVTRDGPAARYRQWKLQPQWLSVIMADPPERESQLQLRSAGRTLTIGRFLTPEERLEVAQALRGALDRWRRPAHLRAT